MSLGILKMVLADAFVDQVGEVCGTCPHSAESLMGSCPYDSPNDCPTLWNAFKTAGYPILGIPAPKEEDMR